MKRFITSILILSCIVACREEVDEVVTPSRVFNNIKIVGLPEKTTFCIGETLDFTGLKVVEVFTDGFEREINNYTIQNDYNRFKTGRYTIMITVASRNKTQSFDINIENKLVDTGLPVIFVETDYGQSILTKTDYVNAMMTIVHKGDTVYRGRHGIRGRGHATWTYPKKPYRVKLDSKANLLGMDADKDWCIMPNYCDKTLMRTSIALKMSELLEFPWTPKARYVEFVLNGQYEGNYQIIEAIKQDSKRVNIPETGFIVERDGYYNQEAIWFTTTKYGFSFKNPKEKNLTSPQFEYIKDYLNEFEQVLYSNSFKDPVNGYAKYIHPESFARWFLLHMLIANIDTDPYLVKEDMTPQSKLSMGPVWDFEWSMGIGWYEGSRPRPADYYVTYSDFYSHRLLQDPRFASILQRMWDVYHVRAQQGILQLFIDVPSEIMQSQKLNFERWDILNTRVSVGGIPLGSFEKEVECDRQFFINRMNWVASIINNF